MINIASSGGFILYPVFTLLRNVELLYIVNFGSNIKHRFDCLTVEG